MELQVTITLSDRLFVLLEDKLPNLGRRVEKAITKEIGAQTRRESSIAVSVSAEAMTPEPAENEKPRRGRRAKADAPEPIAPVAAVEEVPNTENSNPETTVPTLEDCRAALKRTRIRFEGEGYENKVGEGYEKYHKAITAQIKQIVFTVSGGRADKIPDLPEECRAAFIAECDALIIMRISRPPPSTLLNK